MRLWPSGLQGIWQRCSRTCAFTPVTYLLPKRTHTIWNDVYKELGFRDIIFLMLQKQQNSTAGLWTWVWSPGPGGPTPHIIPVHFSDLLFPQLLLLSCRETLTFWDVWTESALCPDLALATVWSGPSQQRHAVVVLVLKKRQRMESLQETESGDRVLEPGIWCYAVTPGGHI